jgi:hypothetical protein
MIRKVAVQNEQVMLLFIFSETFEILGLGNVETKKAVKKVLSYDKFL